MTIRELLALVSQRGAASPPAAASSPPVLSPEEAAQPWNVAQGGAVAPQAAPVAPPAQPYAFAAPDPFAQAQELEQRQQAVARVTSPASPLLGLPTDVLNYLASLAGKEKR